MAPAARRRFLKLLLGAAACAAPAQAALAAEASRTRVVTMLGDSLTAGYGLKTASAIPAQLEAALRRMGLKVTVRAAGVSGDTSRDALERVDFSVKADTDLCLVALGGNDLLRGQDPRATRANLTAIVRRLKARRIPVMLLGVRAPAAIGAGYAAEFNRVVPQVAEAEGARAYPDLLGVVARNPALNQGDGIHPNVEGVRQIVARLAPAVAAALRA